MRRPLLTWLLTGVLVAATAGASAQERTLKLGLQNPKGHPAVMGAERFAEIVAAKSAGRLKVNLFPGGVLGSDAQTVSAVQGGTVEMTVLNSGILASQVKEFAVYDFPFLFANSQEADAVVDGPFGRSLHARLADKGIVGLAYWELGFRSLTNSRRPIHKVEDIAGLKLRVIPNPINIDWVKALDANPTPLAFTELYAALEQRAVDGQENPVSVILANRFAEVQKHLALTNHQYNPQSVIVSKRFWDTLAPADRQLLQEAAVEAGRYQRQMSREQAASMLAQLKQAGMEVTELVPAERARLREKMKPVIDKHAASVGEATVRELMAELAKARK
ncbi:MAG TPA: TRAP transporter substrate-binding protein [Ramlibacter sp.]|jgi:tripartite ATP-independent transporter DctP family solute receptor|uniref:TRAP transporter substrate-binding protein n=1 Tax=Ramlibacter sp. TaxID=1917967 RepID=UPI002D532E9D|nr:TRAP transporter substrate-binding protein [Ramlibacter sp.]HZY18816.1 TRAP transporter substrate-binding protein [Ramlibacter sp.]